MQHHHSGRYFGCIRRHAQPGDKKFLLTEVPKTPIPAALDLRPKMPPVVDQGQLGACVFNATASALEYDWTRQGLPSPTLPSRLFGYYNARVAEGTTDQDSGATVTGGVEAWAKYGFPAEGDWAYDITKFTVKPPQNVYQAALKDKVVDHGAVSQVMTEIKTVLSEGFPVAIGFDVYQSFMNIGSNGVMTMPNPDNEALLGGHCVLVVGYVGQYVICRNSWGPAWGLEGYFLMPWLFLLNAQMASDFQVIRTVKKVASK